ncbi:peptidoglycan-binding domain-containing protein, partial [Streptomyces sp. NPDC002920]
VTCAALCAVAAGLFVLLRPGQQATAIAPGAVRTASGTVPGGLPGNTVPTGASGAPERASAAGSSSGRADDSGGEDEGQDEGGDAGSGSGTGAAGQPVVSGRPADSGGQAGGDPTTPSDEDTVAATDPVTAPTTPAAEPVGQPWNTDCNYYPGKKRTQEGDTGKRVFQIQCILSKRGYDLGSTGIDGVYGAGTVSAVRAFQTDKGLVVDGIIRRATWDVLRATV